MTIKQPSSPCLVINAYHRNIVFSLNSVRCSWCCSVLSCCLKYSLLACNCCSLCSVVSFLLARCLVWSRSFILLLVLLCCPSATISDVSQTLKQLMMPWQMMYTEVTTPLFLELASSSFYFRGVSLLFFCARASNNVPPTVFSTMCQHCAETKNRAWQLASSISEKTYQ